MTSHATGPAPADSPPQYGQVYGDLVTVRILGMPMALQARAQEQNDELTRELVLIAEQMRQSGDEAGLPVRLVALVQQLSTPYSVFTAAQEQAVADAVRDGTESIDLTYQVPASAAGAATALGAILDEADEYCRAGRYLLALATPDELVHYRRWFLAQFVNQPAGDRPVSWAEYSE